MATLPGNAADQNIKEKFSPTSTFIQLVEYDEQNRAMDITFRSGAKLRYLQVYPSTFQSFKLSPTHSAYYARAIKGNLPAVKIIQSEIGPQRTSPLKKISKENKLNVGLRKQQSRIERLNGTLSRAFAAA